MFNFKKKKNQYLLFLKLERLDRKVAIMLKLANQHLAHCLYKLAIFALKVLFSAELSLSEKQ